MPWNMSNPLYRWKMKQGKLNKSVKHKTTQRKVVKMAKRRRRSRIRRALSRYSPRRRFRSFRKGRQPISILTAVPSLYKGLIQPALGGGGYIGAVPMIQSGGNVGDAALEFGNIVSRNFTGYDFKANTFNFQDPMQTYTMIIAGWAGSKLATKLGVNRQMAKVPFLGKYIKL